MKEKIIVFDGDNKTKMTAYINILANIIQNPSELQNYFSGWTWTHMWCPVLPEDFDKLNEYTNASGNFDLIRCEAHLSQLKEALRYLHFEETDIALKWSEKIAELIKMPI